MYHMVRKVSKEDLLDNLSLKLRRGALTLAILSQLNKEQYGYSLKQSLAEQGMEINEGTLYPLLRRLEEQSLLESDWQIVDGKRPRRYYRLSQTGATIFASLTAEWQNQVGIMNRILGYQNR
jgi:DNA-binding PadR family transcriptional regulator